LVIDDEEDNRELVAHILRDGHYDVQVAGDGGEALAMIIAARPDLVVLDLMMPIVDGWQILESIRQGSNPPPCSSSPRPGAMRHSCAGCAKGWQRTS
jgi:CheY-like chemotaxis protein